MRVEYISRICARHPRKVAQAVHKQSQTGILRDQRRRRRRAASGDRHAGPVSRQTGRNRRWQPHPFRSLLRCIHRPSNQDLLVAALRSLVQRFRLQGQRLGDVTGGAVLKHSKDFNLVRECVLSSGLDPQTPGIDMQRACGTGLDATISVAMKIALGQMDAGIAGGFDTVSDPPVVLPSSISSCCCAPIAPAARGSASSPSSASPAPFQTGDAGVLEPRTGLSMGEHCEQMAKTWKISRAEQDALANRQPREGRQRLEGRLLQRPGGQRIPGPEDRQQRARRQHGGETRAAQARVRPPAARAPSPPAIPRH